MISLFGYLKQVVCLTTTSLTELAKNTKVSMGWYHDPNFNWEEGAAAPACSIKNKPQKDAAAEAAPPTPAKVSGDTSCLLPANSAPPPPPPDVDSIFHLCQMSKWDEAVHKREPYFPPTYMSDGKFTRATVHNKDLVSAANQYCKDTPGNWIVVEIDCKLLFSLGIPILAQEAPESTVKQPVKCLQVFGGISTTLPGLIKQTYQMKRDKDGTFLKVREPSREEEKKEDTSASPTSESSRKPRRFWQKK